jgi:hypothetical protein
MFNYSYVQLYKAALCVFVSCTVCVEKYYLFGMQNSVNKEG